MVKKEPRANQQQAFQSYLFDVVRELTGYEPVPFDPESAFMAKRIERAAARLWPLVRTRNDRHQLMAEALTITEKRDPDRPWPYFLKVAENLLERGDAKDPKRDSRFEHLIISRKDQLS